MPYQSKTYSLSDEVVAAIDAAREQGETPNKFLRRVLGLDRPQITEFPDIDMSDYLQRDKATTETVRRGIRQKGDVKR